MTTKNFAATIMILISSLVSSQDKNVILGEINDQIWDNFSESFQSLNYQLFESIHHEDFIRINGNGRFLKSKSEYLATYKKNWQDKSRNISIEFRFLERINSNTHASERGIYKMTINPGTEDSQNHYGKFHVIIQKFENQWKLTIDYDSNENGTINEDKYKLAHAIDDFDKY